MFTRPEDVQAFRDPDQMFPDRGYRKWAKLSTDNAENKKCIPKRTAFILPEDLRKYGLLPELIGRLPVIAGLDNLERDDLIRILTEPKNALCKQYETLLLQDGVKLRFTKDALEEIADRAIERKCGARGLRAIMEEFMTDIMYNLPDRADIVKCVINKETVLSGKALLYSRN